MKILILTNHSYMLYRFRKELIQELSKNNQVILSMPYVGHEDDFMKLGLECIETEIDRRGINPITDCKLLRTYNRLLKEIKPEMVITYSIKPNIYGGLMCKKLHIPYCVNVQGLGTAFQRKGLATFVTVLYKYAINKAKTVFFENEANAQEFIDRKILSRENTIVLNGAGINLNQYPYTEYKKHDVFHFLYLGRIMKEKGIDELFYSVKRLYQEGYQFVLDLVGFFEDEYKEQIDELKDIVTFHGFKEDPIPYYQDTDCVVLPSYHEGMSNVLLEGAAIGRPLITSNIPGCREAVIEHETGLLVEAKNSESLYLAMKEMLNIPYEDRKDMGVKGRELMERVFDKRVVVATTINKILS